MLKTQFTLIAKRELTHDVYELIYDCPDIIENQPKPGHYVMFQLAPGLNRSYSFASFTDNSFTLIIKRIPDGKGSPIICDAEVGTLFTGMLPLGHFVLQNTSVSKCFIGTGTGFAPLYCQMLGCRDSGLIQSAIAFIFGVREYSDVFYSEEIGALGSIFHQFEYTTYLSRETRDGFQSGYVTDWIIPDNIAQFQEFYLCGSPVMVKSAREKLEALGIIGSQIFFEQF